jgi:predicted nucleic acid-binding Zn ribbon protein
MALKLPEHSHCLHCGDPVPYGTEYCSEECREGYRKDKLKNNIRDVAFYATIGLALCILAYRFMF